MTQIESGHPERIAFRDEKSWTAILTGLVFLAGGGALYHFNPPIKDAPEWTSYAIAAGLGLFGLMCLVSRGGVIIDRAEGRVERWLGLPFPVFWRRWRIRPVGVRTRREVWRHRGHTHFTHWVDIMSEVGETPLGTPTSGTQALAIAQSVACFFDLPVYDESENAAISLPSFADVIPDVRGSVGP